MIKMNNIFNLLHKNVNRLSCLKSIDGINGFFQYYYSVMESDETEAKNGYRDCICYEYMENEKHVYYVKFYTKLNKVDLSITIEKIVIF